MRKIALALALMLALPAVAQTELAEGRGRVLAWTYDLDSTTYVYPSFAAPSTTQTQKVTSSATSGGTLGATGGYLISVSASTEAPFTNVAVGDIILLRDIGSRQRILRVVTRTSADEVLVDQTDVTIPTGGVNWTYAEPSAGSAADSGWFQVGGRKTTIVIDIDQLNVTGGIDYSVECALAAGWPAFSGIFASGPFAAGTVASANLTATGVTTVAVLEPYSACRVGLKIGTADDGNDLTTNMEQVTILSMVAPVEN